MLADKLGFYDAFIGEHLTDANENITNSLLFLATLIPETKNIKLATGTTNLSQTHPVLVATHSAMFDHHGQGALHPRHQPRRAATDAEAIGNLDEDRNKLFEEVIDVILEIWTRDPPYNIDLPNNRFKVSTAKTARLDLGLGGLAKPYQKPYPEIVGTVVAPLLEGVIADGQARLPSAVGELPAAEMGEDPLGELRGGQGRGRREGRHGDWRVARTIFVARTTRWPRAMAATTPNSPYRFYFKQMLAKIPRQRLALFKDRMDQPDEEITDDYVMDHRDLVRLGQQDRRSDPGVPRGDRRFRRAGLLRRRLDRSRARGARWSCWRTR